MNRNTAIIWTVLSVSLCGWPGTCMLSMTPSLLFAPEFRSLNLLIVLVGLILLAFSCIVAFRSFQSSNGSGITGLSLVAAISGLLQIFAALIFLIGAGTASNTTGIWETVVFLSVSGLFLVGISISIWFFRIRKPAKDVTNKSLTSVIYKSVSVENDPGYTNSTKIMLAILAIVIVIMFIVSVMSNQ